MQGEFGEYTIERTLRAGTTWLARDGLGRSVVLKRLPDDCLRQGRLHASVRDRLERLREAPVVRFVGPQTVERLPGGVVVVSPYVAGRPLEGPASEVAAALRPIIADLHARGLVHGRVHGGNVIVGETGLTLIDPGPFLHDDFTVDLRALGAPNPAGSAAETPPPPPAVSVSYRMLAAAFLLAGVALAVMLAAATYLRR